jgi:hypothetical protein
MSEINALTELAAHMREVAERIHQPGSSPVGQFPNAILFELPAAIRDPELRELERQLGQLAATIDTYLGSRR